MPNYLSALPAFLQIGFAIAAFVLLTYLLMLAIHRVVSFEVRHQHNEVIGFTISVVAVFYGLIIASVLIISINRFDHAQQIVDSEANQIVDVVRNARAISPEIERPVRQLAIQYAQAVIAKDVPAQKQGEKPELVLNEMTQLAQAVSRYEPRSPHETAYYSQLAQSLNKLYDMRKERIFLASERIAGAVWIVTVTGGVFTICFALLFGAQSRRLHFLLVSFLAISLALIFALIALFDSPFQGDVSVSDEPYRMVLKQVLQRQQ